MLAVLTAITVLSAQEQERVVRGLTFVGNKALDDYTLESAIATTKSSAWARYGIVRWMGLGEKRYFNEVEFRRDVVRLILLYRQSGYMNAVVDTSVRRTPRDVYATVPRATSFNDIPFDRWRELNADGLVIGTVQKGENGVRAEMRLYNIRTGQIAYGPRQYDSANARIDGSWSPGRRSPRSICPRMSSAMRWYGGRELSVIAMSRV